MQSLQDTVAHEAERTGFSGVVRVDRAGSTELAVALGLADGARGVPDTTSLTCTVVSNWTSGAWPMVTLLDDRLGA